MNIFVLDQNHKLNAQYHVDRHVVKMIVEQAQLLCSVYYYTGQDEISPYRLTHKNHPCAIWTRESLSNWKWLRDATLALAEEYTYRYGKLHKSGEIVKSLPEPKLIDIGMTPFAQAMPESYRNNNVVEAYRKYYREDKSHLFSWKQRQKPYWIGETV